MSKKTRTTETLTTVFSEDNAAEVTEGQEAMSSPVVTV